METRFFDPNCYSGLVPGDLDPARSPHYLTTLKRAYLKLRYLVDAGAVSCFVVSIGRAGRRGVG